MHTLSYTQEGVLNNGYLRVRFVAPADKDIHLRLAWTSEGKSRLKSYVGTTYTTPGASIVPFNRQTGLPSNLEGTFFINPTINALGTLRGNDFVGAGGATAARVGGTGAPERCDTRVTGWAVWSDTSGVGAGLSRGQGPAPPRPCHQAQPQQGGI